MSADGRYTIVLTGRYGDERSYLLVDADGGMERRSGYPPAERLRGEISFGELPEPARDEAIRAYREFWGIGDQAPI